MAYQKQNFVDGKPLSAAELNRMEEGIAAAMEAGGGNVPGGSADLTGYAKEAWVQENYQPKGDYPLRGELPSVPVQSVNGKTGAVKLTAEDVSARPSSWMPTAAEVGALPNTYKPPNQTAQQVGADPAGTAANAVSGHNSAADAHADIRLQLTAINDRLKAFFDSDDQTLDELSEIVSYITSNKSLIDAITTSKVSVLDIVNDLVTNVPAKPLSAAQGVVLKTLIDNLSTGKLDASKLQEAINTALAQAKASGEFDGQRGTGILNVTSSTISASGTGPTGIAIKYKIALSTVKDEAGVDEVLVGDTVKRSVYLYPVANVDESYVYLGAYTSIKGNTGSTGAAGADGYTPVRGTDYWTDADKAEIVEEVKSSMDGVPDYWQTALDEGVEAINTALCTAGRNKSAFLFYSDAHWNSNSQISPTLLKYLYRHTGMVKTFFGGDIVQDEATEYESMEYLWEWRKQLKDLPNHHSVPGNHDDGNSTNNLFSEQYVYGYLLAAEETTDIVRDEDGLYYYINNPAEKTRYLCLDTAYQGVTEGEQAFVKSALLSTPENWHIVAIAHAWYASDYTVYPPVLNGFDTKAKILLDMFDSYNARNGQFAECLGRVEFCIGGHYHLDYVEHTDGGIPVIIVEADCLHDRSGTMPTVGTTDESAISAVIADYNTKTVKIIRVGRGADYETTINVSKLKYTNVIPLSVASDGSSFAGGKGWMANSRIGSGGIYAGNQTAGTAQAQWVTGHIEIKDNTIDNVIRLKNVVFDSTSANAAHGVAFFDSSFARIAFGTESKNWITMETLAANGYDMDVVLDGTNVVEFTLNTSYILNDNVKYIAICCGGLSDDSIITINEPIE